MVPTDLADADRETRLNNILADYFDAIERGEQANPESMFIRHPDLAVELKAFFTEQEQVFGLASPLREIVGAGQRPSTQDPDATTEQAASLSSAGLRSFGDYEVLEEMARGGMGVVYRARQKSLNRLVALKVIRAGEWATSEEVRRFRNEAEMVALLDHPHVVPVHEVGEQTGQLYFSMKLIEGGNLTEHLDRYRDDPKAAASLMATVARAVHHAHQRGVLHRDLKPSNILLDEDGRPHVTDFGLARRVAVDSSLTQSGAIVGTPSYVAPEQTTAQKGAVTTATDVYGLGAVLYVLLTGRPPFQADNVLETLVQVREREPEPPRTANRRVDRDLETICLKCLAKEPQRRYPSALAVAEDLDRFLAAKPIQARPVGVWERGIKWARRRPLAVAVGGLVLAVILLGAAVLVREVWHRAAVERAVEPALERAELLQEQERYEDALGTLAVAERQLEGRGLGALRERVKQRKRDVDMLTRLEEARFQFAVFGQNTEFNDAGVDRFYAAAFKGYDLEVSALEPQEAAKRVRASAIRGHLIAALDDWAYHRRYLKDNAGAPLRAVSDLTDDDPWRRRLREAEVRADRRALEALAAEAKALSQPPVNLVRLATILGQLGSMSAAEKLLRRAQLSHPADFWINYRLGLALNRKEPPDPAAVGFMRAALAIRPQNFAAHCNVGVFLERQGNSAEAEVVFREAIRLHPDQAVAYFQLGQVLRSQRQPAGQNPAVGAVAGQLGVGLADQRKDAEIVEAFQQAIALRPDYAVAYYELGVNLCEQRKIDEGIAALKKAIELDRNNSMFRRNLVKALRMRGESAATLVEAYRKLTGSLPDDAAVHYSAGIDLNKAGRMEEAMVSYRRAIALKPDFAEALCNLGLVLSRQGRFAEGLAPLRRGHELGSGRPNWSYPSAKWVHDTERLVALDAKLTKVLAGELQPADAAQRIALAELCGQYKRRYAAAARFSAEAFAADPKLADDLNAQHRYNAACYAALVGCGQGADADKLDTKERAGLRLQALDWLRADLNAYRQMMEKSADKAGPTIAQRMQHWLQDDDFAGVRGDKALDKLPAEKRLAWRKLWADVAEMLAKAQGKAPVKKKPSAKERPRDHTGA